MREIATGVMLLLGGAFMLLAAIGIVRMPDLFTRMQPATKAATLGAGFVLFAVALFFEDIGVTSRAVAAALFIVITAPVAAHMIARAAYFVGVPLWSGTRFDELRGRYDHRAHTLASRGPADDHPGDLHSPS